MKYGSRKIKNSSTCGFLKGNINKVNAFEQGVVMQFCGDRVSDRGLEGKNRDK